MDKIRGNILRWFGNVVRREKMEAIRVVMKIIVNGKKGREKDRKWDVWKQYLCV